MATGAGTGTPATGSGTTLSALRDRVEATLQDSGNALWSSADIDEAINKALDRINWVMPQQVIGALTLATSSREISISTLTGLLDVKRVWWDYDASNPGHPPAFRKFEVWPGSILFVNDEDEPSAGDVARVWYTKPHTINNLSGETTTTLNTQMQAAIVTGAAGYAAQSRAVELAESATVDGNAQSRLMDWAQKQIAEFRTHLRDIGNIESTRQAGLVPIQPLDRWDAQDDGW